METLPELGNGTTVIAGRIGQAWAGISQEKVDQTMVFPCDVGKLCDEWNS
jgi:hypothetical protein